MLPAYVRHADRWTGSCLAARNHCPTKATRITTYPTTMTRLLTWVPWSIESNIGGRPSVKMMTPTICTIVMSRYTQSSVSNAEANQLKLIHAHHTANVANKN